MYVPQGVGFDSGPIGIINYVGERGKMLWRSTYLYHTYEHYNRPILDYLGVLCGSMSVLDYTTVQTKRGTGITHSTEVRQQLYNTQQQQQLLEGPLRLQKRRVTEWWNIHECTFCIFCSSNNIAGTIHHISHIIPPYGKRLVITLKSSQGGLMTSSIDSRVYPAEHAMFLFENRKMWKVSP